MTLTMYILKIGMFILIGLAVLIIVLILIGLTNGRARRVVLQFITFIAILIGKVIAVEIILIIAIAVCNLLVDVLSSI